MSISSRIRLLAEIWRVSKIADEESEESEEIFDYERMWCEEDENEDNVILFSTIQ